MKPESPRDIAKRLGKPDPDEIMGYHAEIIVAVRQERRERAEERIRKAKRRGVMHTVEPYKGDWPT